MAQLTSFEEISNKIGRNEFIAFNIPPELQHLAGPYNKILNKNKYINYLQLFLQLN